MVLASHHQTVLLLGSIALLALCIACGGPEKDSARGSTSGAEKGANPRSADTSGKVQRSENNSSPRHDPRNQPQPQEAAAVRWDRNVEALKLGIPPESHVNGQKLADIITSQVAGRDDDQLCSACHNRDEAQGGYGVDVKKNERFADLNQWTLIGTQKKLPWGGKVGWASRFVANPTKPATLKKVMQAWIDGGSQ